MLSFSIERLEESDFGGKEPSTKRVKRRLRAIFNCYVNLLLFGEISM
jgi:hypothetical protein